MAVYDFLDDVTGGENEEKVSSGGWLNESEECEEPQFSPTVAGAPQVQQGANRVNQDGDQFRLEVQPGPARPVRSRQAPGCMADYTQGQHLTFEEEEDVG